MIGRCCLRAMDDGFKSGGHKLKLSQCKSLTSYIGALENVTTSWVPRGKLKEHQDALPYQPVPPLEQTLRKWLASTQPTLSPAQVERAKKLVTSFGAPGGEGEKLQKLLQQRADDKECWLSDWWIKYAYLSYREATPVNVNPGFVTVRQDFNGVTGQLRYGAMAIASVLEYKVCVDNQEVPIERIGKIPQDMIQYYHVLASCRVPGEKVDHMLCFHAHDPTPPRHVTVMHNNHVFSVPVYGSDGRPLNEDQIYSQLQQVVRQSADRGPSVGLLTGAHRDTWWRVYQHMCQDPHNRECFAEVHRGILVLSLDQALPDLREDHFMEDMGLVALHGGGSQRNTANRWYDKSFQYVVGPQGMFGFSFDHALSEGPSLVNILNNTQGYFKKPRPMLPAAEGVTPPKRLDFHVSQEVNDAIESVAQTLDAKINELQLAYVHFDQYGRDFMKSQRLIPDGYMQACMQLAMYRMEGRLVSTYESGTLRQFRLGRTETIRSASLPVLEFCKAMCDGSTSAADRVQLLRNAIEHHRQCTIDVLHAQGVDRHLMGLRLIAAENGLEMPEFFTDPIYAQSTAWRLSTTTVTLEHEATVFFCPVVADGYGVYYNPHKDFVDFALSNWRTCPTSDCVRFGQFITKALEDVHRTCLEVPKL